MSAISALKGYRTQFLYSLHYILSNQDKNYRFRLEGEEDIDVLDEDNKLLFAIQVKNLKKVLTLSDILSDRKTSFLIRFIENYITSTPVLVSYGKIHDDLLNWKHLVPISNAEKAVIAKNGLTTEKWRLIQQKTVFENVNEDQLTLQILEMLKEYKQVDPLPTAANLMYFLQYTAEKQHIITALDLFRAIEEMAVYQTERFSFEQQYGVYIKPLHLAKFDDIDQEKLKTEFYYGINARYEHIYFNLDVIRTDFLDQINRSFVKENLVIVNGASGQGKSSLAYRYLSDYAPEQLIYEVDILQEDPKALEAIQAITAITKKLRLPVYFVLNVEPNTTNWLKLVKEFTNHTYVKMLVTVRKEDWYRAQAAGIDFSYTEISLELSETEAEIIFDSLERRQLIIKYANFKEAWIDLNENVPLLEFTYSITQGDSLSNRLKKQVHELTLEDAQFDFKQLDFLKTLCLADSFGAKVAVNKITQIPGIKTIVDKLEKEYLLKHTHNGRYLTGLHPVRSKTLVDLLFDEFLVCKKDFIPVCLKIINDEDAYPFLLQCFHFRILDLNECILMLKELCLINWTFYGGVAQSLMWLGIRNYLDDNETVLDQVHSESGSAWHLLADIYHGNIFDSEDFVRELPLGDADLPQVVREIKAKLTAKESVYYPIKIFFNTIPSPQIAPSSVSNWNALASLLFWLNHTETKTVEKQWSYINGCDFKSAFETLSLYDLSQLMLGMYHFSPDLNQIRIDLSDIFNTRLQEKYKIVILKIDEEISFHFIIDRLGKDENVNIHERTVEIIELLRAAYPDKEKYNSQGHGHHIKLVESSYDETTKGISYKNLPLDHWVGINATLRRLYEYRYRPENWEEFHEQIDNWENSVRISIQGFNQAFQEQRQATTFKPLVPVMAQTVFSRFGSVTTPKSIVDPLGLYIKTTNLSVRDSESTTNAHKELILSERYSSFFKGYSDYRNAVENFFHQSGKAICDLVSNRNDENHPIDENNLRCSYINLYDAITRHPVYEHERKKHFHKFISPVSKNASELELHIAATIWKTFWPAVRKGQTKNIITKEKISSLRADFENALAKSFKAVQRSTGFTLEYIHDDRSGKEPIFIVNCPSPLQAINARGIYYNVIHENIKNTEYTSLKYLMLDRYFSKFRFISLVNGSILEKQWSVYSLHAVKDSSFELLPVYHHFPSQIPDEIYENLDINAWVATYPRLQELHTLAADFANLNFSLGHIVDLRFFNHNPDLNEKGYEIVKKHINDTGEIIMSAFSKVSSVLVPMGSTFLKSESMSFSQKLDYGELLIKILEAISPQPGNESTEEEINTRFDMDILEDWAARLHEVLPYWAGFLMFLQDLYLKEKNNPINDENK